MDEKTRERLRHIAQYSSEDIGSSEEGVKLKFIVELLECLGYNKHDMDFESGRALVIGVEGWDDGSTHHCYLVQPNGRDNRYSDDLFEADIRKI